MNTLTFKPFGLSASTPSAGLWQRAANVYWTGWTQYAASMNQETSLRPAFPLWSRRVNGNEDDTTVPSARAGNVKKAAVPSRDRLVNEFLRLVDRAA